jgi:glycine dehydrogenase
MTMFHRLQTKKAPAGKDSVFVVSDRCFAQTIDVLRGRAEPLQIHLEIGDVRTMPQEAIDGAFGVLVQYPDAHGEVSDLRPIVDRAHAAGALVAVASDLLALALLMPPGEMGADAVVGNSQRFGVPLGYGGPHAGFLATRDGFVRQAPGRIIGLSVDARGRRAYRMALQTREQHIRREKATSNICTAQALLANIAAMYAVYHGPAGIRAIAERVHNLARVLEEALTAAGLRQTNAAYSRRSVSKARMFAPCGRRPRQRASIFSTRATPSAFRSTRPPRSRTSATLSGCSRVREGAKRSRSSIRERRSR